jgi:CheY-like chemotaxis protein
MVSHDLRTPLNAILGWAQLLRRELVEPEMREQAFATIERCARTQAELIAALLDVSRIASGKLPIDPRPMNLDDLVSRVLDALSPAAADKEVAIEHVRSERLPVVVVDHGRVRQVLTNVITNALKFTPPRGTIRIAVEAGDGRATISVSDSGRGIARELLPHVFDCFRQGTTATSSDGSLGLGLYIARQLVEIHGGAIEATSDGVDRGATFTITLPLSEDESRSGEHTSLSAITLDNDLDGMKILVVEDDPDTRDILRVILDRYGADVVVATDVTTALGAFDAFRPDVLVSDIGLPGADGCELVRTIRKTSRGARVHALAVSGFVSEEDARRAIDAGFDAHLAKPIAAVDLVRAVQKVRSWRARGDDAHCL